MSDKDHFHVVFRANLQLFREQEHYHNILDTLGCGTIV